VEFCASQHFLQRFRFVQPSSEPDYDRSAAGGTQNSLRTLRQAASCSNGFITKFNPTGTGLAYSTFLPVYNSATPQSIALNAQDNAYVLSSVYGGSMPTVNPIEGFTNQGDVLIAEIDPTGSLSCSART
jgi:hypothetical protein